MELYPEVLALAKAHLIKFIAFTASAFLLGFILFFIQGVKGRWFALMTLTWVVVNGLIAWTLHYHLNHPPHLNLPSVQGHVLFWMGFNLILDSFYILCALGLYWLVRNTDGYDELFHGFGNAVLVQGFGLLGIDLFFFWQLVML